MNFVQAMKRLSSGENVRVKTWTPNFYIHNSSQNIISFSECVNAEWEVYQEESPYKELIEDILGDALTEILSLSIFKNSK